MTTRRYDADQTKTEILLKAKELFSQKGYAATSINEICQVTGISKGSLYYHFKSKEDLFLYLVEENMKEWIRRWEAQSIHYPTAIEKIYKSAEHYVEDFQNPLINVVEEYAKSQVVTPEVWERLVKVTCEPNEMYQKIVAEGIQKGELTEGDAKTIASAIQALLDGLSHHYYHMGVDELKTLYHQSIHLLLRGIEKK